MVDWFPEFNNRVHVNLSRHNVVTSISEMWACKPEVT